MARKLQPTAELSALVQGIGVDPSKVSFYECIAVNSKPITGHKGGLFQGAVMSEATLQKMAAVVQAGTFVPMHTLHKQRSELPVGRIMKAGVLPTADGYHELRSIFYVGNSETDLINKLEEGSIDEVSIGAQAEKGICSECSFDYFDESTGDKFENLWTKTCPDNHTIGENGVHLRLLGLERWYETSLVALGAANGAKILPSTKAVLGETEYNRLTASGVRPEMKVLLASTHQPEPKTPTPPQGKNTMDLAAMNDQLVTTRVQLGTEQAKVTALTAEKGTLTAQVTELQGKVNTLSTEKTGLEAKVAELSAVDATKQKERADKATKLAFDIATKLAVASGNEKPAADATVEVLEASISASQIKLAALPIGGVSQQAAQLSSVPVHNTAASFATPRR